MNLPAGWTAETVDADGVALQAYRVGDGPPVVLAHGFYENARARAPLADALADDHEVVLYDARAHGQSAAPESGYAIEDRVADVVAVVEAFDLENPVLYGHSMGGSTAAWTAATHPNLPRGVVLEDPAGMRPPPDVGPEERAEIAHDRVVEFAEQSVESIAAGIDAYGGETARRIAAANAELRPEIAEIAREGYPHLADAFPRIECPALVLRADCDVEERVRDLALAETLQNGRLVHVPDATHDVVRSQRDAALREIRAFLWRLD